MQSFTSLVTLSLARNNLKAANQLAYLPNLEDLNVSVNQLGNSYSFINTLYNLKILDLSSNSISDLTNFSILVKNMNDNGYTNNLQTLNLGSNNLTDIKVISNFMEMINLDLTNNKIEDISPLEGLTKITTLNLSNNNISNIEPLKNLTKLSILYLDNNKLSDITVIENLNSLVTLAISSNKVKDITPLRYRTLLKKLYANDNRIENVEAIDNTSHNLFIKEDGSLELKNQVITHRITNEQNKQESVTIELPQIFIASKRTSSMLYTPEDIEVSNCELVDTNADNINDSITIKPSELDGKNATVTIIDGRANRTTFIVGQPPTPTITYNPEKTEEKIKGSVEATISFNKENVQITNNNGSKTYTFTDNGEFIFEYQDADGFDGTETAKVDWLDNKGPEASVTYKVDEENKNIIATITSTDEEMQEVEGWQLSDDKKKMTKTYTETTSETVTVKDKLGNETGVKVSVKIITEPEEVKIESTNYKVDTTDKIITKIPHNTSLTNFKKNVIITEGASYKVVNKDGQDITDTGLVTTGSKIITSNNEEYEIVVSGDTDYDGKITGNDLAAVARMVVKLKNTKNEDYTKLQTKAADIVENNNIDGNDLAAVAKACVQ